MASRTMKRLFPRPTRAAGSGGGGCTPEESPHNRQGRRAPLPDRVGVFNRERENGKSLRRSSIRAAWGAPRPLREIAPTAGSGRLQPCQNLLWREEGGGETFSKSRSHVPSPGAENIKGMLLPNLLPNAVGRAEMETDDERWDLREMPTKWDV
jgi:hypothetical protein